MRVLVTGAAGFIGSHLVDHLLEQGHTVVGLDRLDSAGDYSNLVAANESARFRMVWHDLRAEIRGHRGKTLGEQFDWVCHLAASSHVDRSIENPMSFLADNVIGTGHVLEWVRREQPNLRRLLYFSTDEVFGPAAPGVTYTEHSRHWPNNPYASTKAAAEALCPAWANTFGLPVTVTHCTNVYGPRQCDEKFIPLVRQAVLDERMVQVHSRDGVVSTRYYVHVSDVCRAVTTILEKGGVIGSDVTGKYNITGDVELSNLDVAQRIARWLGRPLRYELVEFAANRPKHDQRYAVGGTALTDLGWRPVVCFDEGLGATLAWYEGSKA